MAESLRSDVVEQYGHSAPAAVRCFEEGFEACIAHLDLPPAHRRIARSTNLLERLFGEERRRTKVAPTMWGERPVLKLAYAALLRASDAWRGIRINDLERGQLQTPRRTDQAASAEGEPTGRRDHEELNPESFLQQESDLTPIRAGLPP